MPDWLKEAIANPLVITAFGGAISIPLLNFLATIIMNRAPPPPPVAHDVRSLPETPLLLAAKVHLAEPEQSMLAGLVTALARQEVQSAALMKVVEELRDDVLPALERKIDRNMDKAQLINDRLDVLLHHPR